LISARTTDIVLTIEVPRDIAVVPTDGAPEENASNAGTLPLVTALTGVSPSPFRASTTVSFDLATPRTVRVRVLDLRGAVVRTLVDGVQPAGRHRIDWGGRGGSGPALATGGCCCAETDRSKRKHRDPPPGEGGGSRASRPGAVVWAGLPTGVGWPAVG